MFIDIDLQSNAESLESVKLRLLVFYYLRQRQLNFLLHGPADLNFRQIRIIILISHINIFFFTIYFNYNTIFLGYNKIIKSKNLMHLTLLNHGVKKRSLFHAQSQWSIFFIFRCVVSETEDCYYYYYYYYNNYLLTGRPEIIFPTAGTTKNYVANRTHEILNLELLCDKNFRRLARIHNHCVGKSI